MVYLYATDVSLLSDPLEEPGVMKGLPEERQKKVLNARHRQKRLQSLGAGLLLSKVLNRHCISSESLRIEPSGKPIVDGICFNLAHSGNYVICAVSERPVGCDIEQIKDAPKRVAERSFSADENKYLQQLDGEVYNREFFRIWTKKESFLKMTGTGIRVPLDTLEVTACYLHEYDMPGYQVTVCAEENEFAELSWIDI